MSDQAGQDSEAPLRRRLEDAERQYAEFISLVVHQLRGPMTTISGYAQLLGRPTLPDNVRERARNAIVSDTHRMANLLEELGDAARISSGRLRLDPASSDLVNIARDEVEQAALKHQGRVVDVEGPNQVNIVCDPDRIGQAISALLDYALERAPDGAICLRIGISTSGANIEIPLPGQLLTEDELAVLFEPDVRLPGTGQEGKGPGLKLYIARGIVQAHGGDLRVENPDGQGTLFRMTLPTPLASDV